MKRMSNTRSAVRDMPRTKPNEAMVMTGWSTVPAIAPAQLVAQFGRGQVGGVEHDVGDLRKRRGHAAFARDAVLGRAVGRQRVAAAGLVIAADQFGAGAIEIEDFGRDALDRGEQGGQRLGIEAAAAHVHPHRDRHLLAAPRARREQSR